MWIKSKFIYVALAVIVVATVILIIGSPNQSHQVYESLVNSRGALGDLEDPNARFNYRLKKLVDPRTNRIPQNIFEEEQKFALRLQKQSKRKTKMAAADSWDRRGPFNVGGRTRALGIKQSNTDIIIAGGVSGGVWRSTDAGSTWTKTTGTSDLHSVTAMVEDTTNAGVWYYTTGEFLGNSASGGGASYRGDGVFKSIDDGVSWTQLASTSTENPESFDNFFDYCWNIKIDPTNGDVYVATYGAIFRSTNGGTSFSPVLGGSSPFSAYTDIAISSTGVLYAVMSSEGGSDGVYRSTDGTTWTDITPVAFPAAYQRIVLDIAPSNESVVYVMANNGSNHFFWKYTYVSGDGSGGGGTWVDRSSNIPNYGGSVGDFDSQGGYDLLVRVKPDDENMVFIGGTNLYRSDDAFASSPSISTTAVDDTRWIGGYSTQNDISRYTDHHPDQHVIAFMPGTPSTMISGHDGGLSITTDNTRNVSGHEPVIWSSLNSGYFTTQFYTVAIDQSASLDTDTYYDFVMGGLQDNGTWGVNEINENTVWTELLSGDGSYCAMADGGTRTYRSFQNGVVYRFTNPFLQTGFQRVDPAAASGVLFINPFILDPNDNDIMYYAGGDRIFRHNSISTVSTANPNNQPSGWTELTSTTSAIPGGHTVSTLVASVSSANTVYFGTSSGSIFRIDAANTGATPTVTNITDGSMPSGAYVSSIAVDPANQNNVMVVFSNYSVQSIWYSTNGGTSFTNVSGNLEENVDGSGSGPSVGWTAITQNANLPEFFVGTSTGLYSAETLNGTSTVWEQEGINNIGNIVIDMIKIREGDGFVAVGTHANGVYSYRPPTTSDPEISFQSSTTQVTENESVAPTGGLCSGYADYIVTMEIANPPTGDAIVTLGVDGTSTSDVLADYEFTTNGDFSSPSSTLTFSDGSVANQTFTVRIYDDVATESSETIIFNYSISGTTDAVAGSSNQTHTFTITDNDIGPSANVTLYSEDFESSGGSLPSGWIFGTFATSADEWVVGTNGGLTDTYSAYVSSNSISKPLDYTKGSSNNMLIRTGLIDATGITDMQLSFDFVSNGENDGGSNQDYGTLMYSTEAAPLTLTTIEGDASSTPYQGVSSVTTRQFTLPAVLEDSRFYLGWRWISNADGAGSNPPFAIDNISIIYGSDEAESTLSASSEQYLGPMSTVSFYDESSGGIIATIENTSTHDYGCTTITIDRAGSGAAEGWNAGAANSMASKSYSVNPTTNNPSGTYNITFYFTEAELAGWEAATGKSRNDFILAKANEDISTLNSGNPGTGHELGTSTILTAFGADHAVTSSFTSGFSGFGGGDPGLPSLLPLELIEFTGKETSKGILLEWSSASERNTDFILVERSTSEAFTPIAKISAQGYSDETVTYGHLDQNLASDVYYYRLKMVDFDGSFEYSNTIRVSFNALDAIFGNTYPNPASSMLYMDYSNISDIPIHFEIQNISGQVVQRGEVLGNGNGRLSIDISSITSGIYLLKASSGENAKTVRIKVR